MQEQTFEDWQQKSGHTITASRQITAITTLIAAGTGGLTSRELALRLNPGSVSGVNTWGGVLTKLRQDGVIKALDERRASHHVYVMPDAVGDRVTWGGYQHSGHCPTCSCNPSSEEI